MRDKDLFELVGLEAGHEGLDEESLGDGGIADDLLELAVGTETEADIREEFRYKT